MVSDRHESVEDGTRVAEADDVGATAGLGWLRAGPTLAALAAFAILIEAWIRLTLLPWRRRGSPGWDRTWNRLVRIWGGWTFRIARAGLGMRLGVEGRPPDDGRYLVVANHQSNLDVPMLIHVLDGLDLKFVAHDGLVDGTPAISTALEHAGFAVIRKRRALEDLRTLRRLGRECERNGGSPVLFPEGMRTFGGELQSFHAGGLQGLRRAAGLPVLPVVFDGLWRARSLNAAPALIGARVRVRILDPIPFDDLPASGRDLCDLLESRFREAMAGLRAEDAAPGSDR